MDAFITGMQYVAGGAVGLILVIGCLFILEAVIKVFEGILKLFEAMIRGTVIGFTKLRDKYANW